LAKQALDLDIDESVYNLFPLSFAKKYFHTLTINKWENVWKTTTNASQTKLYFPTICERLKTKYLRPNYQMTQFLSGHGNFKTYLKRFKLSVNELCDCDSSEESPNHLLLHCERYDVERHQFINAIHRSGNSLSIRLNKLISDKSLFKEFKIFLKNFNTRNM